MSIRPDEASCGSCLTPSNSLGGEGDVAVFRSRVPVRKQLADGKIYVLRALHPGDEATLQAFFYSHTEETVHQRYGYSLKYMTEQRARDLVGVNQSVDVALAVVDTTPEGDVFHSIGRYYLDRDGASAETAFVTRESKRMLGMASLTLEMMKTIARDRGLKSLWAQVCRDNIPMIHLFESHGGIVGPGESPSTLRYDFNLKRC